MATWWTCDCAGTGATILPGVLIRANDSSALEMHFDTDEANAAGVPAEATGEILGPSTLISPAPWEAPVEFRQPAEATLGFQNGF